MTTRIYLVSGGDQPRLVRASSQAQAIGHIVRGTYKAIVASQVDLVELLPNGTQIEEASTE